jgi:circadian clock protein KaiB
MPNTNGNRRKSPNKRYVLKLYVTGATRRSQRAITNLNSICHEYLQGNCDVEIVDVYHSPAVAREANVIAAPTLVKQLPLPMRRLIGDLSERGRVLLLLDLKAKPDNK